MPCYGGAVYRLRRAYCTALRENIRIKYGVGTSSLISEAALRQLLGQDLMTPLGHAEIMKLVPELGQLSPFELRELVRKEAYTEYFRIGAWSFDAGYYVYA